MEGVMTVAEAARKLGLKSDGSLRLQIRRGILKAEKIGRDWLVTEDEIERYRRDHLGRRGNYDHKTANRKPRTPKADSNA
jgi:excisionase family DNA binding protein